MALRLLSRVRGTLPQGRSLPDDVWRGRHRAILLILWLHVPALAVLALATGDGPGDASGVVVVATSAALATLPWGGRRWRSALATVGLLSASCVLVSMGGGTVELAFHFFVTIALVMLYQDGFPFLIAVGFVAVYALVSAALEWFGIWPPAEAWSNPWLRAAVGELLILATATANLANWRLNEDSRAEAERSFRQLYEGQRAVVRELQQSQRLKDELYNVVSHELRTPLTGILGFGELLLTRDDRLTPDQRKEHLGRILREARRLQRVVDNLVYSSKVIQQDGSAAADLRGVLGPVIEDLDDVPERERLDLGGRPPAHRPRGGHAGRGPAAGHGQPARQRPQVRHPADHGPGGRPPGRPVPGGGVGRQRRPADHPRRPQAHLRAVRAAGLVADPQRLRGRPGAAHRPAAGRVLRRHGGRGLDRRRGHLHGHRPDGGAPRPGRGRPAPSRRPSAPGIGRTADRTIHRPALHAGPGLSYHRPTADERRSGWTAAASAGPVDAWDQSLGLGRPLSACSP